MPAAMKMVSSMDDLTILARPDRVRHATNHGHAAYAVTMWGRSKPHRNLVG